MQLKAEAFAARQRHVHGPDWRWQLGAALAAAPSHPHAGSADERVAGISRYIKAERNPGAHGEHPPEDFRQMAAARALGDEGERLDAIKLLVVGGCPTAEIADRAGIAEETLAIWEAAFFDVRPALAATHWVMSKVIRPEQERGNAPLAAKMKFALSGGPSAAKAVLDAESRVNLREGETLFDRKLQLLVKFEQAADASIATNKAKLLFVKLHAELMHQESRLRLAERRLAQKSQEAVRKQQASDRRCTQQLRRIEQEQEAARHKAARARERENCAALLQEAEALDRSRARQERAQAEKERAATSALAHLQWRYAKPAPARTRRPRPESLRAEDSPLQGAAAGVQPSSSGGPSFTRRRARARSGAN